MNRQTFNERRCCSRREFVKTAGAAGALLAFAPAAFRAQATSIPCSFAYGSGVYGQSCYAGAVPKLLKLPQTPGNIRQDGFRFFLSGAPGVSYEIQCSSDLVSWTTLGILTMQADGTEIEIHDPDAALIDRRFYRAIPL